MLTFYDEFAGASPPAAEVIMSALVECITAQDVAA